MFLGRSIKHWSDPSSSIEDFKPDRFYKKGRGGSHPAAWLPFGLGVRGCVGSRLAMMEMKIILTCFLQKYQVSYDPSWPHPKPITEFTLRPSFPVQIRLTPRSDK